ncbi:DUF2867 domain-containing protein [Streptomyces triticiradicis]|uniref:DUF2867 domain-containing protein n=1 Tax=Streptomyces triticiradicis TaxID=2651189 RepID=A0A7J5DPA8_9ACTN|nr:DUF2867 domain-containing protein [Streptomyces triticiradicis]KAB1990555.1 DUF2867 domain-containing protein [Streptomyces triticiradicis]
MRGTRTLRNVHERIVQAPAEAVGALLDRLATPDDALFPTPVWPAMVLDRPLAVGADGGHGGIRYRVAAHEPGRSVRFDTTGDGLGTGWHRFDVEPLGPGRCRISHVLEVTMSAGRFAFFKLAIEPVHDTMVEEVFDNAERAVLGSLPHPPARRPRRALLVNRLLWVRPTGVPVPADARLLHGAFERPDFTDAWRIPLAPGMPGDPRAWRHVLPFTERGAEGNELMLGEDASHLDFRASVLVDDDSVTLATAVRLHDPYGRLYFAVVRRVHPYMARRSLRRAHRRVAFAARPAGERNARAAVPPS